MDPSHTAAANIRTARLLRGWTQAELAHRAGVSRRAVNRAEQGLVRRIPILQAIADALGTTPARLLAPAPPARTKRAA